MFITVVTTDRHRVLFLSIPHRLTSLQQIGWALKRQVQVVPKMEGIFRYLNNDLIQVIICVKILKSNIGLDPKEVCKKASIVKFLFKPITLPGC
jgi:hypothetical protein